MSSTERVGELVLELRGRRKRLQDSVDRGLAVLAADPFQWDGVERRSQICIQACCDVADYVLAAEDLDEPPDSRNVFPVLAEAGIIPRRLATRLAALVKVRNALVHAYAQMTPSRLAGSIPEILTATDEFADAVERWLRPAL